jgi:hypothetical protein
VNIVATQAGVVHPEQVYILCAHYDDTSDQAHRATLAPGADDNASGTAAVMAAAAILSQRQFEYTIRYIHFSGEEQGLFGSRAYARQMRNLGEQIAGVITLDMIGYDDLDGPVLQLHALTPASERVAQTMQQVISAYALGLSPRLLTDGQAMGYSDHQSFCEEGFPAILSIEDYPSDFNTCYHQICDRVTLFNAAFLTNAAKAAVGTLATLASPLMASIPTPTPTATPTPWPTPACPNHLADGGFEAGPAGPAWQATSAAGSTLISSFNPRSGQWGAWLSQSDEALDSLCQTALLPAGAQQASLEFWWQMQTDQTSHTSDTLEIQATRAGAGSADILARIGDGDLQHLWLPRRIALGAYAGQSVRLCFVARSDVWQSTYFFLDDIQLNYCGPQAPAVWLPLMLK